MEGSCGYTVTVYRKETVAAALPQQEHWLPLSNLDLLLPPLDVGVFFCYTKPPPPPPPPLPHQPPSAAGCVDPSSAASFAALVNVLKVSLAKTLVTYYPLAGEVIVNSMGEPEIRCNNRGVEFIEAIADVKLADVEFYDADESFGRKLVPKKKAGVLTVQATETLCGGMVLGCTFDHRVADAYSFNMFLLAWAGTAAGKPISPLPNFRRSLLSPRNPDLHQPSFDRLFIPVSHLPLHNHRPSSETLNRIYYITAASIHRLQNLTTKNGKAKTKIEAFIAYLWKLVGQVGKESALMTHMGVVVDGRRRIGPAMDSYFGNVLSIPYSSSPVAEIGMEDAAEIVHEIVAAAASGEHFRGLVDWVEAMRPEAAVARVYVEEGLPVVVSSGRGFPAAEVEFGWGKAAVGSYHFQWDGSAGYVMPMPSPKGNGDWLIYVHLPAAVVKAVEADPLGFFQRLTADYLMLGGSSRGESRQSYSEMATPSRIWMRGTSRVRSNLASGCKGEKKRRPTAKKHMRGRKGMPAKQTKKGATGGEGSVGSGLELGPMDWTRTQTMPE
ncbi:Spermidine hydroxycinnamoyl transferase [Platanthera zijinensis]|uniref:Spermidine hydroxycinnamoyl transferase n=1 Tax=Platanthera zijinensis TaxID=2320716 RepID=A0AAP0G4F6_9ASPA